MSAGVVGKACMLTSSGNPADMKQQRERLLPASLRALTACFTLEEPARRGYTSSMMSWGSARPTMRSAKIVGDVEPASDAVDSRPASSSG